MHRMFLHSAVVTLAALLPATAAEYSLDQLIDTAIAGSKQLVSIQREIDKTDAQFREAYGHAMPKISASVNVSHAFEQYIPYDFGGGGDVDPEAAQKALYDKYDELAANPGISINDGNRSALRELGPIITGATIEQLMGGFDLNIPKNTSAFSVSLNQPLFSQGKISIGVRIARTYKNTLLIKYDGEKRTIISSVTGVYLTAIMARNNVEIQGESVTLAAETHRLTNIRYAIGKATELDTLTSMLHLENARIDLEKAQSDCQMAYEALITLCNLAERASSFSVSGELPEPDFDLSLDDVLRQLHSSNDQIRQLAGGEKVQNELVKLARTDYYPLVFAGGSLSKIGMFDDPRESVRWGNDNKVYIGCSWELFSGFTRRHKISQKSADRDIFMLTRRQAIEGLELAARNAYEKVRVNKKRYLSMSNVITLAEKGYRIAKKSFEVGSSTQLDMQNAELEYNKSRLAFNGALLNYNLAIIELKQLIGSL